MWKVSDRGMFQEYKRKKGLSRLALKQGRVKEPTRATLRLINGQTQTMGHASMYPWAIARVRSSKEYK